VQAPPLHQDRVGGRGRSTLLGLGSAFAGRELILRAYQEAIRERYRFYPFSDALLLV
jgi:S-adenosylmethionine:tRNA ribosyltransferase-isomerase